MNDTGCMHILYGLEESIEKKDSILEYVLTLPVGITGNVFQDEMFIVQQAQAVRDSLYASQPFVDCVLAS